MVRRKIGEILLLEKGGKSQKRWDVKEDLGGKSNVEQLLEMLGHAESLCKMELSKGGCLKLYNSAGHLIKEIR